MDTWLTTISATNLKELGDGEVLDLVYYITEDDTLSPAQALELIARVLTESKTSLEEDN
jgi:hypothetical protein